MSIVATMLLTAYVDDSADDTQERAVVAGGYVGFFRQWRKLNREWRKRLKQDGLRFFHTTESWALRGEFYRFHHRVKYPEPSGRNAATAILETLENIIHTSGVMGIAVSIDMREYKNVRTTEPHASEILPADAFEVALQSLVEMCAQIVRDEFEGPRTVRLICDNRGLADRLEKTFRHFKRTHKDLAQFLGDLIHKDDKQFPQLQAADMLANIAKQRFVKWLDDPNKRIFTAQPAMKLRLKRLSMHKIGVWDRNYMMAFLKNERLRRGLP